jgi:hypothetical protein
MFKP